MHTSYLLVVLLLKPDTQVAVIISVGSVFILSVIPLSKTPDEGLPDEMFD